MKSTWAKFRIILGSVKPPSTYDLVGISIIVFGNFKVELGIIQSCSSSFNFSSGPNPNSGDSSTKSEVAWKTYNLVLDVPQRWALSLL